MTDIADFLTARWEEREAAARAVLSGDPEIGPVREMRWTARPGVGRGFHQLFQEFWYDNDRETETDSESWFTMLETPQFIAANDPAYVLADLAAKRQILAQHSHRSEYSEQDPDGFDLPEAAICREDSEPWPCPTVRLLAAPFADHPDFDPAWRVE